MVNGVPDVSGEHPSVPLLPMSSVHSSRVHKALKKCPIMRMTASGSPLLYLSEICELPQVVKIIKICCATSSKRHSATPEHGKHVGTNRLGGDATGTTSSAVKNSHWRFLDLYQIIIVRTRHSKGVNLSYHPFPLSL